jgi:hypothetical protein
VDSFTLSCFVPRERDHGSCQVGVWVGPRTGLDTGEEKNLLILLRIVLQFVGLPVCSLVAILELPFLVGFVICICSHDYAELSCDESCIASPRLLPGNSYKHLDNARVGKGHVTASAVTQQLKHFSLVRSRVIGKTEVRLQGSSL